MIQIGKATGWLLGKLRKGQVWCAFFSLSLGLSIAAAMAGPAADPSAQPLPLEDRALDPSLAESLGIGVDPSPSLRYSLVLTGSFVLLFLLCGVFNDWIDRDLDGEYVDQERTGILLLSQIALALFALRLIVAAQAPESLRGVLHLVCGLLVLSMIAKRLVSQGLKNDRDWGLVWSILNDSQLMLAALFLPAVLLSIGGLAGGSLQPLATWPASLAFALYLLVLMVLLASYVLIARYVAATEKGSMGLSLSDLNTAVIVAGSPLTLIPLGGLLANELQFAVPAASPRALGLAVVVLLAAISLTLFILQRRGRLKISGVAILGSFYFPVTVATLASLQTHRWTLNLTSLDSPRLGGRILPTQQWAEFGSLPFLDLLPGQGLADVAVQTLYVWIHGVRGLDFLIWLPWIPVVVGFLIVYAYLATVTSPLLALLVTLFLPVGFLVVGQYAVALLPAVLLAVALRKPDFKRFLALWLTTVALLLWRPALGGPAGVAIVLVVIVVVLLDHRELVVPASTSLVVVLGLLPVGLVVAELIWAGDTYSAFGGFLGMLARPAVGEQGAIEAVAGMHHALWFLQGFLPVVAVICVLAVLLRRFVRRQAVTVSGYGILYLVVFSYLMPARLGMRPSGSLFDPSFLLLILALMPFLVIQQPFQPRQVGRSSWLLTVVVLCAFLGSVDTYHLLAGGPGDGWLRTWRPDESRVFFDSRPHKPLVDFLRRELESEETFLDFTGSAAVYALASQRYPLRKITDFRQTTETLQRSQISSLAEQRSNGLLPWVVFRRPTSTQGLSTLPPTESISYRVVEFIYDHYDPYAKIGKWEVWRGRGVKRGKPKPPAEILSPSSIRQDFRLGNLPLRWAREDPWQAVSKTEILASALPQPIVLRPGTRLKLPWTPEVGHPAAAYLHVRARSLSGGNADLTVFYGRLPKGSFNFQLAPFLPGMPEGPERVGLELLDSPKRHKLQRVLGHPGRRVFRADGQDPWLHRFVDLSPLSAMEERTEQSVALWYHSTQGGSARLYFAPEGGRFAERHSVDVILHPTRTDAGPRMIAAPVVGVEIGARLGNLRFDPPTEGEFEIVAVEWTRHPSRSDDYLIRLTTQFQWSSGGMQPLSLRSEVPVLIESVHLRTGD